MKTSQLLRAFLALISLGIAARAGAASLTMAQAIELRSGLAALDGYQKEVPQGSAPAKLITVAYDLGADARWKIFAALTALKPTLETFEAARADLMRRLQLAADDGDKAQQTALEAEATQLLARRADIELPTLHRGDLNLAKNPIPGTVLAALAPVLADK